MPTNFTTLLTFVIGGGLAALIAPLLDRIKLFRDQHPDVKRAIVVLLNVLLAGSAYWVQRNITQSAVDELDPLFTVLLAAVYATINQISYARVVAPHKA